MKAIPKKGYFLSIAGRNYNKKPNSPLVLPGISILLQSGQSAQRFFLRNKEHPDSNTIAIINNRYFFIRIFMCKSIQNLF